MNAIEAFNTSVEALASLDGNALPHAIDATEADPDFILAKCLIAFIKLYAMTGQSRREALEIISNFADDAGHFYMREQMHLRAARNWASGNLAGAIHDLEKILLSYPRDLLAAKIVQDLYLFIGDSLNLRDSVNRVFFSWPIDLPGYSNLLAMRSFGLEETYAFDEADKLGRLSLQMNPRNVYARHSVTHVFEMLGNRNDGIEYLKKSNNNWNKSPSNIHMWWHFALLYLDEGEYDKVLEVYDDFMCETRPVIMHDIGDRASLLWRLYLLNEEIGDRGIRLMTDSQPYVGDSTYVFNEFHLVMSQILGGKITQTSAILDTMKSRESNSYDGRLVREVGIPFCEGLVSFGSGNFEQASDIISSIRYRATELGGSHAQQDVLAQTALVATAAAGSTELTRALCAERMLTRPNSTFPTEKLIAAGREWKQKG